MSSDPLTRLRELADEQAALRRVATFVAGDAGPDRLFAGVCGDRPGPRLVS